MPADVLEVARAAPPYIDHLRHDPLAWQMRCDGFSLRAIEDVIERAAFYEFDAGMGEITAAIQSASDAIDRLPDALRWHRGVAPAASA